MYTVSYRIGTQCNGSSAAARICSITADLRSSYRDKAPHPALFLQLPQILRTCCITISNPLPAARNPVHRLISTMPIVDIHTHVYPPAYISRK